MFWKRSRENKKIKIAFVINDFFVGGAQRLLINILSSIDREKFEVTLITLFSSDTRATLYEELPKDIPVITLSFHGFSDLQSIRKLYQTFKTVRPDIVSSHLFFANTITRLLKPFLPYKIVTAEHNTYETKTFFEMLTDTILSFVTVKIIAVSETVKMFTSKQEHISLEKFAVIHNGINISHIKNIIETYNREDLCKELDLDPSKKYIVSVARLTKQKNHKLLIDGFDLFAKSNNDYELLIVGDGGMKDVLEAYTTQKSSAARMRFFGNRSDVYKFYYISDFFISTSDIEGFGIAHIEAMTCGIPVVTTKTAGPDEFIQEGKNGYFINGKTPESVALSIQKMIQNTPSDMKEFSQKTADKYDVAIMVKKYEELFTSFF